MSNFNISDKAYAKIMLHCIKHTSNDCFGILLGKKNDDRYDVTDAVPLSHDKILAPQLEICLKFIENNLEDKVIGLYENLILNKEKDVLTVSHTANYIGECIYKVNNNEAPVLFEISSIEKVDSGMRQKDEIVFKVYRLNNM
jgi:hypothetical protein